MQSPKITHNHPQSPTTILNHLQPLTIIYNHPQPPKKLPKKVKTCHKQLCYCTLDVNNETDVDFDSDMKQWYIYMCVLSVCLIVYTFQVIIFAILWLD